MPVGSTGALTSPMVPGRGAHKGQEHQGPSTGERLASGETWLLQQPFLRATWSSGWAHALPQLLSGMFLMDPVLSCRSPAGPGALSPTGESPHALLLLQLELLFPGCHLAGGGCRLEIWGAAIPHGVLRAGESLTPPGDQSKGKSKPCIVRGSCFLWFVFLFKKNQGFSGLTQAL